MQGEHKWGNKGGRGVARRTGAGQCRRTMAFHWGWWWGGGRGSEREQSASWGRDIGVSNKQTTDTYKYNGCTGLFLNTHNEADSRSVTEHKNSISLKLSAWYGSFFICEIRTSITGCESETLVNWLSTYASMCVCVCTCICGACQFECYILRLKSVKELPSLMQETFGVTAAE